MLFRFYAEFNYSGLISNLQYEYAFWKYNIVQLLDNLFIYRYIYQYLRPLWGGYVLLICRLVEIAQHKFPDLYNSEEDLCRMAENVLVDNHQTCASLIKKCVPGIFYYIVLYTGKMGWKVFHLTKILKNRFLLLYYHVYFNSKCMLKVHKNRQILYN